MFGMQMTIKVNVDQQVRRRADEACAAMGIELSDAVGLFLDQVATKKKLPFKRVAPAFDVAAVKAKWEAEAAWAMKHGKRYATAKELLADIV